MTASFRQELQNDGIAGKPPPGVPKEINGVKIYPARQRDDKQAAMMVSAAPRSRGKNAARAADTARSERCRPKSIC